jgi:ADP-ribose pyrophosphatase YjhB (NUDIX family)
MELDMPQQLGIIFEDNAPQISFKQIQNLFGLVAAGGGLVSNEHNDLLMIFRRGKWDLPKGKLDKGETIEDCALREISEETGLSQLTLGEKLCETYHIYDEKGKKRIKYATWFKMMHTARENLVAQTEEDIEEVLWVNTSNLAPFMSNTYSAIKDVLITAGMRW